MIREVGDQAEQGIDWKAKHKNVGVESKTPTTAERKPKRARKPMAPKPKTLRELADAIRKGSPASTKRAQVPGAHRRRKKGDF